MCLNFGLYYDFILSDFERMVVISDLSAPQRSVCFLWVETNNPIFQSLITGNRTKILYFLRDILKIGLPN